MANYLYRTVLYHDTSKVVGEPATNAADLSDFTTNHASSVVDVTGIDLSELTFTLDKSYGDFDTLVSDPYDWTDVRCNNTGNAYELYLLVNAPL